MDNKWRNATKIGDLPRVRELLDTGIDIDSMDEHGQTALMNAAHSGNIELTHILIRHGAKLDHTAKHRLTALMLAVIGNHPEIVRMLIDAGADLEMKGSKGSFDRTPLEYAQESGFMDIADILRGKNSPRRAQ